ncbi:MAG: YihA family ribosome biogenesis GTP-binding protein [Deltaproteobacteria bacterium]|nr:MAG: YihA family ribosome biogenesis GTP-binding protein [Deltaproteobacteria bacterium]
MSRQSFSDVKFLTSVFDIRQLPAPEIPEIAFAGRSNVGKSSLLNRLIKRKKLVKTSAKPGKTQSLNFFLLDSCIYLVDLPGYGYAKVSKKMQAAWQELITAYLETRENLKCVVVIVDLRHELKIADLQLVDWLRSNGIPFLLVYTKADKLSANQRSKNAAILDAGFGISESERLLFSAKTGMGRENILLALDSFLV